MALNIEEAFDAAEDEFLKFHLIENPPTQRPDLCGFLLLDKLVPGAVDIISASEHDEFYIEVSVEALSAVATQEDIVYLARCGVRYDSDYDCLCMFA